MSMKKIIVCGSMNFITEMKEFKKTYENSKTTIIIPDTSEKAMEYDKASFETQILMKKTFIHNHLNLIKLSDCILIWNPRKKGINGYVGTNTLIEMTCAYILKKPIFIINPPEDKNTNLEILGMEPIIINQDFTQILT